MSQSIIQARHCVETDLETHMSEQEQQTGAEQSDDESAGVSCKGRDRQKEEMFRESGTEKRVKYEL